MGYLCPPVLHPKASQSSASAFCIAYEPGDMESNFLIGQSNGMNVASRISFRLAIALCVSAGTYLLNFIRVPAPQRSGTQRMIGPTQLRSDGFAMRTPFLQNVIRPKIGLLLCGIVGLVALASRATAQMEPDLRGDRHFNDGMITTGAGWHSISGRITRTVVDIVVPGSVGKYPLTVTRTMCN